MKILLILLCIFAWSYGIYSIGLSFDKNQNVVLPQKPFIIQEENMPESEFSLIDNKISEDIVSKEKTINTHAISSAIETWEIQNLEVFKREFTFEGKNYFVFRKFVQNNIEKYLILDDATYETSVIVGWNIDSLDEYGKIYENSQYKKHQDEVYSYLPNESSPLQNNGIISNTWWKEVFLTADFCPSRKHGFEKQLLETFIEQGHKNIWIAITSKWIEGHPNDYKWLIEKNNSNELNISWINHTKTHNYSYGEEFSRNFILTPWLELSTEILTVEEDLLKQWQVPSIFMRYTGLVSDKNIRKETIYTYWLFPVGANAWLAKWETPTVGSIILIHGNKNEHYGIQLMNSVLKTNNFEYWSIENIFK